MKRKLRRHDVVTPVDVQRRGGFRPGRVWRRIDEDHVQVIETGLHIIIYRDDQLILTSYTGRWKWKQGSVNEQGNPVKLAHIPSEIIPMPSLRRLKQLAKAYNAHFGGQSIHGDKWTKQDRMEALADREVYVPGP